MTTTELTTSKTKTTPLQIPELMSLPALDPLLINREKTLYPVGTFTDEKLRQFARLRTSFEARLPPHTVSERHYGKNLVKSTILEYDIDSIDDITPNPMSRNDFSTKVFKVLPHALLSWGYLPSSNPLKYDISVARAHDMYVALVKGGNRPLLLGLIKDQNGNVLIAEEHVQDFFPKIVAQERENAQKTGDYTTVDNLMKSYGQRIRTAAENRIYIEGLCDLSKYRHKDGELLIALAYAEYEPTMTPYEHLEHIFSSAGVWDAMTRIMRTRQEMEAFEQGLGHKITEFLKPRNPQYHRLNNLLQR